MAGAAVDGRRVNVGTAWDAGFFIAPEGTAVPASASDALDAAFYSPGYLSDDGVELGGDYSTDSIMAWQSIVPVRKVITGRTMTLGMTLIETAPESLAIYFDTDKPTETDGAFSMDVASAPSSKVYTAVVDILDGATTLRFVFPRCSLSEAGGINVTRTGAIGYPVTLEALDASGILATVFRDGPAA